MNTLLDGGFRLEAAACTHPEKRIDILTKVGCSEFKLMGSVLK